MLDGSLVKSKFDEFQKEYADRHIDDYESFVTSRTIEYFYNTQRQPIDELASFIVRQVKDGEPCAPSAQAPDGKTDKPRTNGAAAGPVQSAGVRGREKTCPKKWGRGVAAAIFAICAFALGRCEIRRFRAKKGWLFFLLRGWRSVKR